MRILHAMQQAEASLLSWSLLQRRRRMVLPAARLISRTGDGYLPVITPIVCLLVGGDFLVSFAWQMITLFVVERAAYFVLKNGLRRQRPAEVLPYFSAEILASDKFSFPSGHTSAATLYAALMFMHFPMIGSVLFVWAAAVGASRVILGVHYPSDILAGAALGLSLLALL